MNQPLPTFPLDFNIQTFTRKMANDVEKRQRILIPKEMERIYNLVMAHNNLSEYYYNDFVKFQFNTELNEQSKKYILEEIVKRFPYVKYATGSYYDKGTDSEIYNYHDIINVTDADVKYNCEYIISLTN